MKKTVVILSLFLAAFAMAANEPTPERIAADATPDTEWSGKKVAFLGDSMTDPKNKAATTKYWEYLRRLLGIEPHVFARSGHKWKDLQGKAEAMRDSMGTDVDAIILWCGTNDYNDSKPIGKFFTERIDTVNVDGEMLPRIHRQWAMDDSTYCGSINRVLSFLKSEYPDKQVIVMTPIHRGYANFGVRNVQPDEDYANGQNLYIEDYVKVLREAAALWAIPVIDLYSLSGILPNLESHTRFIGNHDTDRLHPNNEGHYRIARTIQTQLRSLPVFNYE